MYVCMYVCVHTCVLCRQHVNIYAPLPPHFRHTCQLIFNSLGLNNTEPDSQPAETAEPAEPADPISPTPEGNTSDISDSSDSSDINVFDIDRSDNICITRDTDTESLEHMLSKNKLVHFSTGGFSSP